MNSKRLQEIRKRCDKATEGPWFTGGPNDGGLTSIEDGRYRGLFTIYAETHEADFIAHARTDVPDLLDEIERLENEVTKFKQGCEDYFDKSVGDIKQRLRLADADLERT